MLENVNERFGMEGYSVKIKEKPKENINDGYIPAPGKKIEKGYTPSGGYTPNKESGTSVAPKIKPGRKI